MGNQGNIRIDKTKCTTCGICVDRCILDNLVIRVSRCRQACPLHLNCQGYLQLVSQGKFSEALDEIYKSLPFPGIMGRICSQPCEKDCRRREKDKQPVAIRQVKRFLSDYLPEKRPDIAIPKEREGKVAIVGSGPAGMMAAFDLRKRGYHVTIFEARPRYGGMLTWGIPEFRLPAEIVDKEFKLLFDMGIQSKLNAKINDLEGLSREFDALFVATGASQSTHLGIPGEGAKGVYYALDFLRNIREGKRPALGKRVLVIGGGNTAVAVAQTTRRVSSAEVTVVCLESPAEMPAFSWEIENAAEEGVIFQQGWGPEKILSDTGKVTGVEFRRCLRTYDAAGNFSPVFDDGDHRQLNADTVVIATGQLPDLAYLKGQLNTHGSFIKVDAITLQTSNPKVFAGGDVIEGRKTVIDAMAHGRRAATSIERFLSGEGLDWGRQEFDESHELEFAIDLSQGSSEPRSLTKKLTINNRLSFKELELGLTADEALREAGRCLKCGEPYAKRNRCWHCLPCEVDCPYQALKVEISYLVR